ncbi:MAG: hypothetical protein KID04_14420 [Clostridium sp.]|nr:hypothetical protein [Clostridium sp.]
MADLNNSLERINRINSYNEQILDLARYNLANSAAMSMTAAVAAINYPLATLQANMQAISAHASIRISAMASESLNSLKTNIAMRNADLLRQLSQNSMASTSIIFQDTYRIISSITNELQMSASLAPLVHEHLKSLTAQWENIYARIPTSIFGDEIPEISFGADIADDMIHIIEQAIPIENEEKNDLLQKLKGKISISDAIAIIGILISILFSVYSEISSDAEQKRLENQNQTLIQENQDLQDLLKKSNQRQEEILIAIQQLTDTAQNLEAALPAESLESEQEDHDLHQINSSPDPEN